MASEYFYAFFKNTNNDTDTHAILENKNRLTQIQGIVIGIVLGF